MSSPPAMPALPIRHYPRAAAQPGGDKAPPLPLIPARWMVGALVLNGLVVGALMARSGVLIDWRNPAFLLFCAVNVGLVGLLAWGRRRAAGGDVRLHDFASHGLMLMFLTMFGAVASYQAATYSSGFYDAALERADQMLHFNWLAWYGVVVRHPLLQRLGAGVYASAWVTPWVLVFYHSLTGGQAQLRAYLASFWLGASLTIALFPLIPAKGALDFLWHGPIPYMPTNGLWQGIVIPQLRAHTFGKIEFTALRGLVCAPSFHTVCALTNIAAVWRVARLRWWLLPLNLAMLLATPVEGEHYLTDMLLGALVTALALGLVRMVVMPLAARD